MDQKKNGSRMKRNGSKSKKWDRKKNDSSTRTDRAADDVRQGSMYDNDFEWYNKHPALTKAASQIPFPYRPGMVYQIGEVVNKATGISNSTLDVGIPGVYTIHWSPSLGRSNDTNSPISTAAKEMYAKVRSAFSGTLAVDAPDFPIYCAALDSVFAYIASLKRIFRIADGYSPDNYVTPYILMQTLGYKPEAVRQIQSDKMRLFGVINELISMTRSFTCPEVYTMFNRHYMLNDNVYMDAPTINAQFYAFVQDYYYKFELKDTPEGVPAGGLTIVAPPDSGTSVSTVIDEMFAFGLDLINALAQSEDAYTINGYLKKAYEGVRSFVVDELQYGEKFNPVYNEVILMQIENCTSVYSKNMNFHNEVSQDPLNNAILCDPVVDMTGPTTSNQNMFLPTPTLNIRSDDPTIADVVEASRLSMYFEWVPESTLPDVELTSGYSRFRIISGTEIVLSMNVTQIVDSVNFNDYSVGGIVAPSNSSVATVIFSLITNFDWAPKLLLEYGGYATAWDVHNVTAFSLKQLKDINRVCLYSEFDCFSDK